MMIRDRRSARTLAALLSAAIVAVLVAAGSAQAAIVTFGSTLSGPATLNTAENLDYVGTFTPVPPNPEAPNGIFHTNHSGADTALWNTSVAGASATAPATGQATKLSLEGCAEPASGGPEPLTQIHFQDLSPVSGGGAHVNLSSQAFDIPVCGQNGASDSTVTSYEPINLCVAQGDYVAFNDEGGYVPNVYRSGVPYEVMGRTPGATMNSFIRGNGTNNGDVFSPSDKTDNDGFAENTGEELMMQVTLATGSDATHICAGGTAGLPPVLPAVRISPQTDGVNHARIVSVAVYCRPPSGCSGSAVLTYPGSGAARAAGHTTFNLTGDKTSHVSIRLTPQLITLIRKKHGVSTLLTVSMNNQTFTQTIKVKIY